MDNSGHLQRIMQRSLFACMLLALSACTLMPTEPLPEPVVIAEPEPVPEPAPEPAPPPVAQPPVVAEPPVADLPPEPAAVSEHVAIVLSGSIPAYVDVASHLVDYLESFHVYDMSDRNRTPRQAFSAIADSNAAFVVAIGLYAANVAKSFASVPVVFSQVFNVTEHELLADDFKGVSVLPPMDLQVEAWRELDPDITTVGAILGEGHDDLLAETERALARHGMTLQYAIARSDRETLYHFKRLIRDIDGFLLFPDNRVLSRTALAEIMADAARHQVQVAVFNDSLLEHGATFSTNALESDIADRIVLALNAISDGNIGDLAPLSPLTSVRRQANPEMVRKFGLDVGSDVAVESVADAQ